MEYYREDSKSVFKELDTDEKGLSSPQVKAKREKFGYNELKTEVKINPFKIFIEQFKSFIIYILLVAVIISVLLCEYSDALLILIILMANAIIGFYQEFKAQKSLEALKQLVQIKAKVFRDGNLQTIESKYLVPGDIISLEAGDRIPADARIIDANLLKIQEAALTGESVPVAKHSESIKDKKEINEQKNMLFSSTVVTEGSAKAVIVETGMNTEIGKITELIQEAQEEKTPLQIRLDAFGKKLSYAIIAICVMVFIILMFSNAAPMGAEHSCMFNFSYLGAFGAALLVAVALAVAAVPEGLPAVVTVALSVGVKRLLRKRALVRKLSSVETLGSCDVICSDKTGTLTKNEMTVRKLWSFDGECDVEGAGYTPQGTISGKVSELLLKIGAECNNASLYRKNQKWTISGDPTEAALLVSAQKAKIKAEHTRICELPFDSNRKRMSVLLENKKKFLMYTKGAPDHILEVCTHVLIKGKEVKLTKEHKHEIMHHNNELAAQALRVLAFAYRSISHRKDFKEEKLVFVGLQAMIDPPRPDVIESIKKTKEAGIRVIMITGDYKETAKAIGSEIGIEGEVVTGQELNEMTELQLSNALKNNTNIFARVMPEHKQKIIATLQKHGHFVAMTGDGVNDAPALKKANIGVAVGSGTDVAKEASDFVLLDDSFSNIVDAIEEGRGIYDNIQKTIMHLLSGNLTEVLVIFLAIIFGWSLPLTAAMILWINLITDGFPALALSVDPYSNSIMKQKPRNPKEGILPKEKLALISYLGIVGTIITLYLFWTFKQVSLELGQTMAFTFVITSEIVLLLIIRSRFDINQFTNSWLWIAIVGSFAAQALLLYTPLGVHFDVVALTLQHIGIIALSGFILFLSYYLYHYILRKILFKE